MNWPCQCAEPFFIAALLFACPVSTAAELWTAEQKLFASDPGIIDQFAYDVAVDGERLVVGAPFDNKAASDGGAAYVFEHQPDGTWSEVAKLMAGDTDANHYVGTWVTIDGPTVAAAAPGVLGSERHVHVFEKSAGAWIEVATLTPPDGPEHDFSSDVALDGDTLLVGASLDNHSGLASAGAVYVFERDAGGLGNWGPVAKLTPSDALGGERFGHSVDVDGDTLVGGARHGVLGPDEPGAAYVFQRDEAGTWMEVAKLTASDAEDDAWFGNSVAIDGDTIAIGAPMDDEQANASGAIYLYERDAGGPGAWGQVGKLLKSDAVGGNFGWAVALDGDTVVGGTTNLETVYVFQRHAGGPDQWGQLEKLEPPDGPDQRSFGWAAAVAGDVVAVGAPSDDDAAFTAGAAYLFSRLPLTLTLSGTCPGTAELALTAATPGNPVALLRAAAPGTSEVPAGPCAGTPLALDDPKLLGVVAADADGELTAERTLPESACGRALEAVDLASCRTSGAVAVP